MQRSPWSILHHHAASSSPFPPSIHTKDIRCARDPPLRFAFSSPSRYQTTASKTAHPASMSTGPQTPSPPSRPPARIPSTDILLLGLLLGRRLLRCGLLLTNSLLGGGSGLLLWGRLLLGGRGLLLGGCRLFGCGSRLLGCGLKVL